MTTNNPFNNIEVSQPGQVVTKKSNGLLIALTFLVLMGFLAYFFFFSKSETGKEVPTVEVATMVESAISPTENANNPAGSVAPTPAATTGGIIPGASGLTICSGPAGGIFEKVVSDINNLGLELSVLPTTGAGDNLIFLHDGKCEFALINSDDYWGRVQAGNDPRIKTTRTVMGLYESVVHMVALDTQLNKFSQTDGKRVGVTGGAIATFNDLIVPKTGLTFDTIAYSSTKALAQALVKGEVDMIVMVGAKPQPWLSTLSAAGAHLVEFDRFDALAELMTGKVNGFLGKKPVGPIDYPNLGAKPIIQLTTRTVLATTAKAQQDPKVAAKIKEAFKLINNNISSLRESGNPSWKTVSTMNDPGGLPWANIR